MPERCAAQRVAGDAADAAAPIPLRVLYVDDALIAVDKPPGLLVHPSALDAHETDTALARLRAQRNEPLWTVHRLDKGTSGVLLFARSAAAARQLGAAFESGAIGKRYIALVRGWPPEHGDIDQPLARDPERPSEGQPRLPARTRYRLLMRHEWPFGDGRHARSRYATVEVEPLNGRRHQIRRHFKHIAHPLVGDSTHGKGAHNRAVAAWLGTQRLWLHALQLDVPPLGDRGPRVIVAAPDAGWQPLLPAGYGAD